MRCSSYGPASRRRRSSAARASPIRRSAADGCRAPTACGSHTRPASPCASGRRLYIAPSCGIVWWLSSTISSALSRQVVEQARRRLAGRAARQESASSFRCRCSSRLRGSSRCRSACAVRAAALRRSLPRPCSSLEPARAARRGSGRRHATQPIARRHVVRRRKTVKRGTLRLISPVSGSNSISESISSSNSSTRTASRSDSAGKMSMTSPRTR